MTYKPSSEGLLAPIQKWLDDPDVSEILLNKPQEVFVEKSHRMIRYAIPKFDTITLNRLFQLIANENQQELSAKKPMLSGNLLDGNRVQLILPPTAKYHTFSIRKKVVRQMSLRDYRWKKYYRNTSAFSIQQDNNDSLSNRERLLLDFYEKKSWDEFIRTAIAFRKNIVISGGTSTGKTTFLNSCLREISRNERIILLEDTCEIDIPHRNQVQLFASKGDQGLARVSMQDLIQCSLRLRPDRIIVGEVRGKEILDFIAACATGHEGSFTSIHANNPRVAFMRMCQMYKLNHVPAMSDQDIFQELNAVVDIIFQLSKTQEGRRLESVYYKYASKN